MALTAHEELADIQAEIGESSADSLNLIGHLTSAESCDRKEDLIQHLLEARYQAEMILANLIDQLSRLA